MIKKKIISTCAGIAATLFTIFPGFAQNNSKMKLPGLNSFNISIGAKTWLDAGIQEFYKNMFIIKGAYERALDNNVNLEGSIAAGSKNKKSGDIENILKIFEINGGINKYFLVLQNKKIALYGKAGLKKISGSEKINYPDPIRRFNKINHKTEANSWGYYLGAGFETKRGFQNLFLEFNYNSVRDYNLNNLEITGGMKVYF